MTEKGRLMGRSVIDAHVHLWDPARISYPWLDDNPNLRRRYSVADLDSAAKGVPLQGMVLVEGDCAIAEAEAETRLLLEAAAADSRILAIVARADPTDRLGFQRLLERYAAQPVVRGIRQNIQGKAPGFCLSPDFVAGVQELGQRGLTFDLCVTHDQLPEVLTLAEQCPHTSLVLDHCGKPDISRQRLDPWRAHIDALAALPHLHCKISGLLTEADPQGWDDSDLLSYVEHVVDRFGAGRLIYGGDWPVLSLAGTYREWYLFTRRFSREWGAGERASFYRDNALRFYGVTPPEADDRR